MIMLPFLYEDNATDLLSTRCTFLSYSSGDGELDIIYNFLFPFSPPPWQPVCLCLSNS